MKKHYSIWLLILLLACTFNKVCAQNIPPTAEIDNSFYNRMNYIFSPLEKNRVPNGLLKDFALEFTDLDRYNGSVNDSNYVDKKDFFDIYQTLFTSRIHSNAGTFVNPIVADSLWYLQRDVNLITIGGLCYGYSFFREDAYSNGLLTINNDQISDRYVNGIWQNPYQTALSVAFAPVTTEHQGRNILVLIPSVAWFTNQQVSSIQLDAGDGNGYQNLLVGQASPVFYPDSGLKTLNFKVTLANNQVLFSHSQIHITNAVNPADDVPPSQLQTFSLVAGPQEIESDEEYEGKKAKGFITIRYANPGDPVLRRPLIIAEGYDPGHILNPEEKYGNNNILDFYNQLDNFNSTLTDLIINNPQYDIVYIDWKKGTDDLYRNAKLLKKVIALVNENKALNGVTEDNVIIGQSMGGVITRIALREMEISGVAHQTRLFISQDSPQQGANTPIAYQYMGRHFRNIYISTGVVALGAELVFLFADGGSPLKSLSLSNQPASKQMLINYISDFGTLRNDHHDNFYASLRSLGYPQGTTGHPFRMVAMSNGSECANTQGFEPGASLLSINGKVQTRFLGDIAFTALSYYAAPFFPLSRIFKIGILPGKNEFNANINLNAIGNGGGNQVYYCDINYKKKLFYLVDINVTLAHKEKDADSGMLPIDGYPGGFLFPTASLQSASLTNWFIKYNLNVSTNRAFNFIPTTSSLDIGGGFTTLNANDYQTVYSSINPPVAPRQTPFANFIVARQNNNSINENHLSFTGRNADWAGNEITTNLAGTTPPIVDCSYLCTGSLQISGPSQFCTSSNYSISNLPSGTTITWSVSGGLTINGSNSSNPVNIVKDISGTGILTATITNDCGTVTVSKAIQTPYVVYPIEHGEGTYQFCAGSFNNNFFVQESPNASDYTWSISPIPSSYNIINNSRSEVTVIINNPGTYTLNVAVTTECGIAYNQTPITVLSSFECSGGGGFETFSYYPNPASTTLTIDYSKSNKENVENKLDKQIKLINEKGIVEKIDKLDKNNDLIILDITDLPNGTYYLHVTEGKETIKKQIIIKH